jgi:hypothetical protein
MNCSLFIYYIDSQKLKFRTPVVIRIKVSQILVKYLKKNFVRDYSLEYQHILHISISKTAAICRQAYSQKDFSR